MKTSSPSKTGRIRRGNILASGAGVFIVAENCAEPGEMCFCVSMAPALWGPIIVSLPLTCSFLVHEGSSNWVCGCGLARLRHCQYL